jgi:hypothetical protein
MEKYDEPQLYLQYGTPEPMLNLGYGLFGNCCVACYARLKGHKNLNEIAASSANPPPLLRCFFKSQSSQNKGFNDDDMYGQ